MVVAATAPSGCGSSAETAGFRILAPGWRYQGIPERKVREVIRTVAINQRFHFSPAVSGCTRIIRTVAMSLSHVGGVNSVFGLIKAVGEKAKTVA